MDSKNKPQMNQQLTLSIELNDEAVMADFCWKNNDIIKHQLTMIEQGEGERFLYLWGPPGCGKSHLLQAFCQENSSNHTMFYCPLAMMIEYGPEVLEGLEAQDIICLDGLDAIAGISGWEEALFHLYNKIRQQENTTLIMSASKVPSMMDIALPDLQSRLSWGLVLPLQSLNDEDKILVIQRRAVRRGFVLTTPVAQFLLSRCARNMHELVALLDKLDQASLATRRKITIPFAKETLAL